MPYYIIHNAVGSIIRQGWSSEISWKDKPNAGEEILKVGGPPGKADKFKKVTGKGQNRKVEDK